MASPPFRGGSERHLESHSTTNPNSTGGRPPAAQLEFSQAMTDFKVMFPDMDAEVIEAVLRANNGAVDATIDHLLTMSADNEAEKLLHDEADAGAIPKKGRGENQPDYTGNPPSYQQATQGEFLPECKRKSRLKNIIELNNLLINKSINISSTIIRRRSGPD